MDHERFGAGGAEDRASFRLLIQKKGSEETIWVSEESVHRRLVEEYFCNMGGQALETLHAGKKAASIGTEGVESHSARSHGQCGRPMGDNV